MSPILVRPVREQLEHDRIIRLLLTRLKRKHDIAINVGDEQTAGIKVGAGQMFPDLVLTSPDRGKRLEGVIEVETGESVNHLEAMAQWAHFGRMRAPFHLYVPATAVDIAKRLCAENQVNVAEIWSYHTIGDQTRFTLVQRDVQRERPRDTTTRDVSRHAERDGESKGGHAEVPRKRPTPSSRSAAAASSRGGARKAAPAARGAKPRSGRATPAPKKSARTQKRK